MSYKENTVPLKKAGNNLKAVGSSDVTEEPSKVSASDVTLYNCSACGKFFCDKDELRSHVRSCHRNTYVCPFCEKVYISKSMGRIHYMETHQHD